MGFNIGIALGSGTKSFVDEQERQRKNAWEDEQRKQLRQNWARQDARNKAITDAPTQTDDPNAQTATQATPDASAIPAPQSAPAPTAAIPATAGPTGVPAHNIPADPNAVLSRPATAYDSTTQGPSASQTQALPAPPSVATTTNSPTNIGPDKDYSSLQLPPAAPDAKNDEPWPPEGGSTKGPMAAGAPATPQGKPTPAAPVDITKPVDTSKPDVNDQGVDLNKAMVTMGQDGKVYRTTSRRDLTPGERQREVAISLMKLPDEEAFEKGSALLNQSAQTMHREHIQQFDDIMNNAIHGKISATEAITKLMPGAISNSGVVPGNTTVKLTDAPGGGKVATITLNVPGAAKPVSTTIRGSDDLDILAQMRVKAESLFTPELYQKSQEMNIHARTAAAAETTAAAHKQIAETGAGELLNKNKLADEQSKYYGAHANQANAMADYYRRSSPKGASGKETMNDKIDSVSTALQAADPTLSEGAAKKQAAQMILKDPNANTQKDLPASLNQAAKDYSTEVSNINQKAPDARTRIIAIQKKYHDAYKGALDAHTGYTDPFANGIPGQPAAGGAIPAGPVGGAIPGLPAPGGHLF